MPHAQSSQCSKSKQNALISPDNKVAEVRGAFSLNKGTSSPSQAESSIAETKQTTYLRKRISARPLGRRSKTQEVLLMVPEDLLWWWGEGGGVLGGRDGINVPLLGSLPHCQDGVSAEKQH